MKKIKGFTLVELLAVIVVLGILVSIAIVMYTKYVDKTRENITNIEEKNIIAAASSYYEEFKDTRDYIKEDIYDGDMNLTKKTYSCVTLKSLIEKGYFKTDVKFSNSKIDIDKAVIKISTVNGVSNYEVINNPTDDTCSYYKINKDFDSVGVPAETELDNQNVKFDTNISNVNKVRDIYNLDLDLTLETKNIVNNYPVYVLLVLDKSGSMAGNRFTNSRKAAINLSKTVVAINEASYIGMIQFDNKVSKEIDFRRTPLKESDFKSAGDNTNVIAAFDKAVEKMSALPERSLKYVIFLTDGQPWVTSTNSLYEKKDLPYAKSHYTVCDGGKVSDKCKTALINYRDKLTAMDATLVIVSYDIQIAAYQDVVTTDTSGYYCPNGKVYNGSRRCYYESKTDGISTLFDSLSNAVSNLATVKSGLLTGTFNDIITVYDPNTNEEVKELNALITFDSEKEINISNYDYLFQINNGGVVNCGKSTCTFDILNNFELKLFNKDGIQLPSPEITSPQLKINITPDSYLN